MFEDYFTYNLIPASSLGACFYVWEISIEEERWPSIFINSFEHSSSSARPRGVFMFGEGDSSFSLAFGTSYFDNSSV
jgi:hypothetical protein